VKKTTYSTEWLFALTPGQPFKQGFPVAFPFEPEQGEPDSARLEIKSQEEVG
jgi:hypothetical protein